MIVVLDAHAVVWWLRGDRELSRPARATIADPQNVVLVSAVTVWELAIKRANGKIALDVSLTEDLEAAGFAIIPILATDAESAAALPQHHRDPFDRMVIAQAARLDAVIVTRDRAFEAYDAPILPA